MNSILLFFKSLGELLVKFTWNKQEVNFRFYLFTSILFFVIQFFISDFNEALITNLNTEFLLLFSLTILFLILKRFILKIQKWNGEFILRFLICCLVFFVIAVLHTDYFFKYPYIKLLAGSIVLVYVLLYILQINYLLITKFVFIKLETVAHITKSVNFKKSLKIIASLLYFIFFVISLQTLILNELLHYSIVNSVNKHLTHLNIYLSLVVLFLLFSNPELLNIFKLIRFKKDRVKSHELLNPEIWVISRNVLILNLQDQKLEVNVFKNLKEYISMIQTQEVKDRILENPIYKLSDLSKDLLIQNSHLHFIFKYHCTMSFSIYKKSIQIEEAVRLLNENYLVTSTIDSLAFKVGFDSYSPFYTNFKKFTGVNPQDYNATKKYLKPK